MAQFLIPFARVKKGRINPPAPVHQVLAPESKTTPGSYTGYEEVEVDPSLVDRFYCNRELPVAELPLELELQPNQYVVLKGYGSSQSAIGRYHQEGETVWFLTPAGNSVWGISPRNVQQKMALDLLLDRDIPLVTITGRAGTGKTLLALAAGLHLTQEEALYQKLLIARPGQRKGTLEEILAGLKNVQVEALTYIRGRTLPGQYFIIDEAQNLTRHAEPSIPVDGGYHGWWGHQETGLPCHRLPGLLI